MSSAPQIETLIQEKRALEPAPSPLRRLWEETGDFTQFLLRWQARPRVFTLTQIFVDELRRRHGLRAYGVKVARRRSKINQIHSSEAKLLEPRQLEVANDEAA